jgi:hypothetical protein
VCLCVCVCVCVCVCDNIVPTVVWMSFVLKSSYVGRLVPSVSMVRSGGTLKSEA